jgi:hypothetical protein
VHDNLVLGGPVWWFALILLVLAGLFGLFTFFDSLFVRRAAFDHLREPRWSYTVGQGAYLLLLGAAQMPSVPQLVSGIAVLVTPLALAQSLAYTLRAVFPAPAVVDIADEERTDAS